MEKNCSLWPNFYPSELSRTLPADESDFVDRSEYDIIGMVFGLLIASLASKQI